MTKFFQESENQKFTKFFQESEKSIFQEEREMTKFFQESENLKYTKFFQESEKSNPKTRSGGRASRVKINLN